MEFSLNLLLYRIAKTKYIEDLSGEGARLYGGRWNPKGYPALYTTDSTALATLETLVHHRNSTVPKNRSIITLELPEKIEISTIVKKDLPERWWIYPASSELSQLGKKWLDANKTVVISVPSAIIYEGEGRNYILNPRHKDYAQLKIVDISDYNYDIRLFQN